MNDRPAELLTPFDFVEMFRSARSFAIVGNSESVLNWDNGSYIDSHDVVIRFNRAITSGVEEKVGGRTDVLFSNQNHSVASCPGPAATLRPRCVVSCGHPVKIGNAKHVELLEWLNGCKVLLSFDPDIIGIPPMARTRPLTNGTKAIYLVLSLFTVEKLFVTGFTFHGMVAGGSAKYWGHSDPQPEWSHELDQEARVYAALLEKYQGELRVTDDVARIVREFGGGLFDEACIQNGATASIRRDPGIRRRLAEGLGWRLIRIGARLRRIGEVG